MQSRLRDKPANVRSCTHRRRGWAPSSGGGVWPATLESIMLPTRPNIITQPISVRRRSYNLGVELAAKRGTGSPAILAMSEPGGAIKPG